jgi:hypothetical protein
LGIAVFADPLDDVCHVSRKLFLLGGPMLGVPRALMSYEAADFSGQVAVIRQNGTCAGRVCWHTPQTLGEFDVPCGS